MMRRLLLCLLLAAPLPAQDSASESASEGAFEGVYAVRGERVLEAVSPERLFVPGSVQKLLVTAAALHHLGPEYRLTTRVRARGPLQDGVLEGDLVVDAAGDPTWNERFHPADPRAPLRLLARRLHAAGVRRATGDLVIDASRFPGRPAPLSRPLSELAYAFAAPVSALAVDESTLRVEIAPGPRIGAPGSLRAPAGTGIEWINEIRTVGRERHEHGTVDFLPVADRAAIVARGEYPISEPPYRMEIAVPQPDLHAARALARILAAEGVALEGTVRVSLSPVEASKTLTEIHSPPLVEILPVILEKSHNWYAEMLLRILAAALTGEGRDDTGLEIVERFLVEEVGLDESAFVLDDASGLSPYNLLTPRAVVELLLYARRQPWSAAFTGALARPGRGTLRYWGSLPLMAGKTGTIRHALALAGYLESEPPVVFAVFYNHHRGDKRPALRREIGQRLRRWARTRGASP